MGALTRLDQAFAPSPGEAPVHRRFPLAKLLRHVWRHPRALWPGAKLSAEVLRKAYRQGALAKALAAAAGFATGSRKPSVRWTAPEQASTFLARFGRDPGVTARGVHALLRAFEHQQKLLGGAAHKSRTSALSQAAAKQALDAARAEVAKDTAAKIALPTDFELGPWEPTAGGGEQQSFDELLNAACGEEHPGRQSEISFVALACLVFDKKWDSGHHVVVK